jgi:hypothetical protein
MDVKDALDKFGKSVVKQARTRLTKKKKNAGKDLYNTLDYELKVSKNKFQLSFEMIDYGKFVNDGVVGTEQNKTKSGGLKLGRNKFKYKKGIENKPSYKHFIDWVKHKGVIGRNKKGQFITRVGLASAISYGVWRKGQETTSFFTRPFDVAFKQLPDELAEAQGLELEKLLKSAFK